MQIFTFRERFNAPRGTTFVVRMNRNMKARTYLRGHSLLQLEVALEEEVPQVELVAAQHGRGEVEVAVSPDPRHSSPKRWWEGLKVISRD